MYVCKYGTVNIRLELELEPVILLCFQISSLSRKHLPQLSASSSNIEDIISRAYDSFDVQLSSLQVFYSKPGICTKYLTITY